MDAPAHAREGARSRRRVWPTTAAVGLLCVLVAVSAAGRWALIGPLHRLPEVSGPLLPTDLVSPLVVVALAGLGALVVLRGDGRRYGWLLLAMGVTGGVVGVAADFSVYAVLAEAGAGLPLAMTAGWLQDLWMIPWMLGLLLLPALFPDGTTASARWRRPVRVTAAAWVALIVVFALAERALTNAFLEVAEAPANPTGVLPSRHGHQPRLARADGGVHRDRDRQPRDPLAGSRRRAAPAAQVGAVRVRDPARGRGR